MLNNSSNKHELRKIFKQKRAALTPAEVEKKSHLINQNFIENLLPQFLQQKPDPIFAIYNSLLNEVSTKVIIEYFQQNNIKFAYPKITKPNQPLEFILAQKDQNFSNNNLYKNISEPCDGEKITADFLIIPLVTFDDQLNRIGMGGGFFDRTIEDLKIKKQKITITALAYDFQRSNNVIKAENNDQKPHFIVTESKIISSN